MRPILFVDIDGVILRERPNAVRARDAFEVASHALLFLSWTVENFDVRWLSAHCQGGDAEQACHAIRYALPATTLPMEWRLVEAIPAVPWGERKIDAIDLSADFLWIDDNHGPDALAILAACGMDHRAIEVNVNREPDDLLRALRILAQARGLWRGD